MVLVRQLTSEQNLEETQNQKCLFPKTTKRTTSNLTVED